MEGLLVTGTNEDFAGFLNAKGWDVHEEPAAISCRSADSASAWTQ